MINDKENKTYCFCKKNSKCPTLTVDGEVAVLGGKEEGYTYWEKGQLEDFIQAAKNGEFDELLNS